MDISGSIHGGTPGQEGEVTVQLNNLRMETDALEKAVAVLRGRLLPALKSEAPTVGGADKEQVVSRSTLAEAIRCQMEKVLSIRVQVGDLTNRCEL